MAQVKELKIHQSDCDIWEDYEKDAWKRPREFTVSSWADENRVLDARTSSEPGPWRTSKTSYLKEIMDCRTDPTVSKVTFVSSTQVGKTECLLNMIGYSIDQDAGPTLIVQPDEPTVKDFSKTRVLPMIEASPALKKYIPRNEDDISRLQYALVHMYIYFAGAQSPGKLASKPIRDVYLDELDKYPKYAGKEASPAKLAEERQKTFWNKFLFQTSTPTTEDGPVLKEYAQSDQRKFYVPCPHCDHYQLLYFDNIKFDKAIDPERIKRERSAYYECEKCKTVINDRQKIVMVEKGVWAPKGTRVIEGKIIGEIPKTSHRGYWINCLYSPWVTFSEVAAEFLNSKNDPSKLMNFINSWLAEAWKERQEETKETKLRERCLAYRTGSVPDGCILLTAGVDVQEYCFKMTVRGWGYNEESWLLRASRLEKWEDVEEALFLTEYGNLRVRLAAIDSRHKSDEVYEFCRKYRHHILPIKGIDHLSEPFKAHKIDKNRQGKSIPGSLIYYSIDTTFFKNKLHRFIHGGPDDIGQWHLPEDVSDDYISEMCAEAKVQIKDKKGRIYYEWRKKTESAVNDYWDTENYNMFAAYMARVPKMRRDARTVRQFKKEHEAPDKANRGGWIPETNDWLNR